MGLVQEGDFTIAYNKWDDAIVHHLPTDIKFIGCGNKDRGKNLIAALDALEKVLKVKQESPTAL